ncbi:MAG: hypothetical protein MUF60_02610 [Vicinamibacterales bacterium]|nr:hypothetical protein [Vicinamibacterales bacterium]
MAAAAARETGGEPDRTLGAVASPSAQLAEAEFDLPRGFASLMRAEAPSWRELARAWHVESIDGDPCAAAQKHQVHCFRTNRATLSTIRQMDRPGILTLRDAGNRAAYAVLRGLSEKTATLSIEGEPRTVSLISLADFWRGEFATFWRVPQGYSGKDWATWPGPGAQWLARQLSAVRGDARPVGQPVDEATLRGLVHAFQLTQGLPSDGIAGPVTLMQLNRALGVDEPRLASWR